MARKLSMKDAINEAVDQEMTRDPTVIMMGEDIVGGAGASGEEDAWGAFSASPRDSTPNTATR